MKCRWVKTQIALWVGNDLDEQCKDDVRRHVHKCSCCREHLQSLQSSMHVLQEVDGEDPVSPARQSLWPRLEARINSRQFASPSERFNPVVPVLAVTAACLTILVFSNAPREPQPSPHRFPPTPYASQVRGPIFPVHQQRTWSDREVPDDYYGKWGEEELEVPEGSLVGQRQPGFIFVDDEF